MIRIALIAIFSLLFASAASAQVVYNPNSPRGRRDLVVHPPVPASNPQTSSATLPQAWGTLSTPIGQTIGGTIGAEGWTSW